MDSFTSIIHRLLDLLIELGNYIVGALVAVELWLRGQLTQFGLPPVVQTVILLAAAVLLVVVSLRLFGGLIRVAVLLVLILIAAHVVLPALPH
jgi:hypothetical protein